MKKMLVGIVVLSGALGIGLAGLAMANRAVDGEEPAMMVSPSTIVLAKVSTLTVHTNILATDVESGSVALDGVAPTGVGADTLGHLVAKFAVADLCLASGEATLTLSGAFTDGTAFSASDVVSVK